MSKNKDTSRNGLLSDFLADDPAPTTKIPMPTAEDAKNLCPIEGKTYDLQESGWISVRGWRFRFARPAIIRTKKGLSWLGFTAYFESPPIPSEDGLAPDRIALVLRSVRIYKGRLYPAMAPFGPGRFYNMWFFNKTLAQIFYEAVKQWKLIADNPELTVDGVKNPCNTIAYSKATVAHAMAPYVPAKKKEKPEENVL